MEQAYLDQQAGILAGILQEGKPCPVCGSLEHPAPAVLSAEAPTQVQLEAVRADMEKANARRDRASANAHLTQGQAESARHMLVEAAADLISVQDLGAAGQELQHKSSELQRELRLLQADLHETKAQYKRIQELADQLPKYQKELDRMEQQSRQTELDFAAIQKESELLLRQLDEKRRGLEFANRDAAEKQISAVLKQAEMLERQYQQAEADVALLSQRKTGLDAQIGTLEEQLDKSPKQDLALLQIRRSALLEDREKLLQEREIAAHRLSINRGLLTRLETATIQLKELYRKWSLVRSLSDTINGTIAGKEKIMLETYVQMTFFDRVLRRANLRLLEMTGGRYSMRRRKAEGQRSQTGLELDVVDHGTGMARSICTLSGGESFQASLCLALGMSDELRPVGGVRLETLFVDEGFGSLDEEALRQAMLTLHGLSEDRRLVGIISHVEQLKQWVDKQICVVRLPSGQSSVSVVTE